MTRWQDVINRVERNTDETVKFLQELVSISTENPPGSNFMEIARTCAERMKAAGCSCEFISPPSEYVKKILPDFDSSLPRVSTVGKLRGSTGKPVIVFNGHVDTVAVGSGWSVDPFEGKLIDGAVFGRGASDNKGGVASMIMALRALRDEGIKLAGGVTLAAVCDEEIDAMSGTPYLIENGHMEGDFGINVDGDLGSIGISVQGNVVIRVTTEGLAVHSSVRHLGVSAVDAMAKLILNLEKYDKRIAKRSCGIRAPSWSKRKFISPTANVGLVKGGNHPFIVPDRCIVELSRRITPKENVTTARKELLSIIRRTLDRYPKIKWKAEILRGKDAAFIDANHQMVKSIRNRIQKEMGKRLFVCGLPWGTDMTWMANMGGLPTCVLGPSAPFEDRCHGVDEHLPVKALIELTKIHAIAMMELVGVDSS
jgi:acetylornithine deacetylase/succinyl-diaminopimelate desuccinylase family protein